MFSTQCYGAGAGGVEIILRPWAGAENIFTKNVLFCQLFGGLKDKEKLIYTSNNMVLPL